MVIKYYLDKISVNYGYVKNIFEKNKQIKYLKIWEIHFC